MSGEISWLDIPEVASDPSGTTTIGEIYQPFRPSGAGREKPGTGAVESNQIVPLVDPVLPAISTAVAVEAVVIASPPLMLADPKTPEIASVAEADVVTGEINHPFIPFGEGIFKVTTGGMLSTFIDAEDIVEVSP